MESQVVKSSPSSPLIVSSPMTTSPNGAPTVAGDGPSVEKLFDKEEVKEPHRSPSPEAMKCAICLGDLVNKSYSSNCSHEFCFACLLEWSKIKAECPLCKSEFRSIIHNIRSNSEYDEYHVPVQEPPHRGIYFESRETPQEILNIRARVDFGHSYHLFPHRRHEIDHRYSLLGRGVRSSDVPSSSREHSHSRDQRMIRILELGPMSEGVVLDAFIRPERVESTRYSSMNTNPFFNEPEETFGTSINLANSLFASANSYHTNSPGSRELIGYQKRRRVYDRGQWVSPFNSTLQPGSVFFPSLEYIRTHPSVHHRVGPFLYRELQVLLGLTRSRSELGFLYDFIMNLLTRFEIRSRDFRELIHSYFGPKVKHFQHELYHFVLSGMKIDEYDNVAAYHGISGSSSNSRSPYVPPSVVTISDDDDDEEETPTANNSSTRNTTDDQDNDDDDIMLLDSNIEQVLNEAGNVNTEGSSNISDDISIVASRVRSDLAPDRLRSLSPLFPEQGPLNLTMGSAPHNDINLNELSRENPDLTSWLQYHSRWDDHQAIVGRPLSNTDFPVLGLRNTRNEEVRPRSCRERETRRYETSLRDRMQIGGGIPSACLQDNSRLPSCSVSRYMPDQLTRNGQSAFSHTLPRYSSALSSHTEPMPNRPNSPISEDEGCVLLGVHPVVKKPPLAVITISSDEDEAGPSRPEDQTPSTSSTHHEKKTEQFKDEQIQNTETTERDSFLAWNDITSLRRHLMEDSSSRDKSSTRPPGVSTSEDDDERDSTSPAKKHKLMSVIQRPSTSRSTAQEMDENSSSSSISDKPYGTRLQEAKRKKKKSKKESSRRKSKKKDKTKEKTETPRKGKEKKKKEKKRKRILRVFSSTSSDSEDYNEKSSYQFDSDNSSSDSERPPMKMKCTRL